MAEPEVRSNKPTLCWFCPLPPARTGIADYTAQILPYLVKHANVILWTDQRQYDKSLEEYARVQRFEVNNFDLRSFQAGSTEKAVPIYHIGNNGHLHKSVWEASQKVPGITVLHDTRLQHLFAHVIRDSYRDGDLYLQVMRKHYGENGFRAAARFLAGGHSTEEMAAQFPLVRLAARDSIAAIVHSEESRSLLKIEGYPGAAYFPFPYASQSSSPVRSHEPPFRIVICGYLGPNRRIDSFLRALGSFPDKNKFTLEIYGPIWDPAYIDRILKEEGLVKSVQLLGFKPIAELDSALRGAHLAVNLRFPTMGEASMSQLQLWDHGIPSMVTPVGWYGHLPEGTVLLVRPDHEIEDIQTHLRAFLQNPDRFFAMGDRARETLRSQHSPEAYALSVVSFAANLACLASERAGFELADRVVAELSCWGVAGCARELADTVAREISVLTSSGGSK